MFMKRTTLLTLCIAIQCSLMAMEKTPQQAEKIIVRGGLYDSGLEVFYSENLTDIFYEQLNALHESDQKRISEITFQNGVLSHLPDLSIFPKLENLSFIDCDLRYMDTNFQHLSHLHRIELLRNTLCANINPQHIPENTIFVSLKNKIDHKSRAESAYYRGLENLHKLLFNEGLNTICSLTSEDQIKKAAEEINTVQPTAFKLMLELEDKTAIVDNLLAALFQNINEAAREKIEKIIIAKGKLTKFPDFTLFPQIKVISIGETDLSALNELSVNDLPNLEGFILFSVQLSATPVFGNLPKLKMLNVVGNNITNPPVISNLKELILANFSNNRLTRSPEFGEQSKLRVLSLENNFINSMPDITKAPCLEELDLSNNQIRGTIKSEMIKQLYSFQIHNNPILISFDIATRKDLKTAQEKINTFKPENLVFNFEKLENNSTNILATLFKDIDTEAKNAIKRLTLTKGKFSYWPKFNLPNLQSLIITESDLTAIQPNFQPSDYKQPTLLKPFFSLQYLEFSNNTFNQLPIFGQLSNVRELILTGNKLTTIPVLDGLIKLHTLDLSNNDLHTGDFKSLEKLKKLNLKQNPLTEKPQIPFSLTELHTDKEYDLAKLKKKATPQNKTSEAKNTLKTSKPTNQTQYNTKSKIEASRTVTTHVVQKIATPQTTSKKHKSNGTTKKGKAKPARNFEQQLKTSTAPQLKQNQATLFCEAHNESLEQQAENILVSEEILTTPLLTESEVSNESLEPHIKNTSATEESVTLPLLTKSEKTIGDIESILQTINPQETCSLELDFSTINETTADSIIDSLKKSPSLNNLDLVTGIIIRNGTFKEWPDFSIFPALKELIVENSHLRDINVELSNVPNLRILSLYNNNLTKTPHANHLTKLEELDLGKNYLTEPLCIDGLKNLKRFGFEGNAISALPNPLDICTMIEEPKLDEQQFAVTLAAGKEELVRRDNNAQMTRSHARETLFNALDLQKARFRQPSPDVTASDPCLQTTMAAPRDIVIFFDTINPEEHSTIELDLSNAGEHGGILLATFFAKLSHRRGLNVKDILIEMKPSTSK